MKSPVTKEIVREGLRNGAITGDAYNNLVNVDYYVERVFDRAALEAEFGKNSATQMIRSLSFHFWVAKQTGVKCETYHGDGKQCRAIAQALQEWADPRVQDLREPNDGPEALKELLRMPFGGTPTKKGV
jgi:hypothetical protein